MPRKGRSYPAELKAKVAVEANAQRCQRCAVRSPIPAAAAAADTVVPSILFSRNRRTCASVTNPSSQGKTGSVTRTSRRPPTGNRIVVDLPK